MLKVILSQFQLPNHDFMKKLFFSREIKVNNRILSDVIGNDNMIRR